MTIEEFIRARLDDDERIAREADSGDGEWSFDNRFDHVGTPDETVHSLHHSEHIARHDPARALRQVAANRTMLTLYATHRVYGPPWEDSELDTDGPDRWTGADAVFEALLATTAAIWSDHPDYRPEWSDTPATA